MGNNQIQEQRLTQEQRLAQSITQQQLLHAQLVELPITQLVERVNAEMDDNPAIETSLRVQRTRRMPTIPILKMKSGNLLLMRLWSLSGAMTRNCPSIMVANASRMKAIPSKV